MSCKSHFFCDGAGNEIYADCSIRIGQDFGLVIELSSESSKVDQSQDGTTITFETDSAIYRFLVEILNKNKCTK